MENQSAIVKSGGPKLLIEALDNVSLLVRREAARCLGNLSANAKYAKEILKNPDKYFTQEVLEQLDEISKEQFSYGSSI